MLDKVTKSTFEPMKGQPFTATLDPERTVTLELIDVSGNGLQGVATREQFSLHFRGPRTPELAQQIYRLEHAQLGALEIFLVPIGRDASSMTYEAVFT